MDPRNERRSRMERLEDALQREPEIADAMNHFFDTLEADPDLKEAGTPCLPAFFEDCIDVAISRTVRRPGKARIVGCRVAEYGLVHGTFVGKDHFGAYFGFEASGLVGIAICGPDRLTNFLRMRAVRTPGRPDDEATH